MEREIKRLKRSRIPLVKVRWNSRRGPEFTWEREDSFKKKYPQLFTNRASSSTTSLSSWIRRSWLFMGGNFERYTKLKKIIALLRLAIGSTVGRKVGIASPCLIGSVDMVDKLHMVECDTVIDD
ncbi:hypothetical protein Tco_0490598 [Tanacetum coccineum]